MITPVLKKTLIKSMPIFLYFRIILPGKKQQQQQQKTIKQIQRCIVEIKI
jgi:preprotein translocase subunit YajC